MGPERNRWVVTCDAGVCPVPGRNGGSDRLSRKVPLRKNIRTGFWKMSRISLSVSVCGVQVKVIEKKEIQHIERD